MEANPSNFQLMISKESQPTKIYIPGANVASEQSVNVRSVHLNKHYSGRSCRLTGATALTTLLQMQIYESNLSLPPVGTWELNIYEV